MQVSSSLTPILSGTLSKQRKARTQNAAGDSGNTLFVVFLFLFASIENGKRMESGAQLAACSGSRRMGLSLFNFYLYKEKERAGS